MRKKMVKSLALATALTISGVGAAHAVVNLDAAPAAPIKYASELVISATTGQVLNDAVANILDTTVKLGIAVGATQEVYARFNLSNGAKFVAAPTIATATATVSNNVGGAGAEYIIAKIVTTPAVPASQALTLSVASNGITVYNTSPVSMTYTLYPNSSDAVSQTNPITSTTGSYIDYVSGITSKVRAVTAAKIDVGQASKFFVSGGLKLTQLGDIEVGPTSAVYRADGTLVALADLVGATTQLEINGDFSHLQNFTGTTLEGTYTGAALKRLYLDDAANCSYGTSTDASTLTSSKATFVTGSTDISAAANNKFLCMETNGVSVMTPATYTGDYNLVAKTATVNPSDISLGTVGTLVRNGISAPVPFALTPGGAFPNMTRITNTSGVSGIVYVRMTNDEGTATQFNLATVAGNMSGLVNGELPAGASTSLITIDDLYAAAQAADSTFATAGNSNKLRLVVEGEFSSITVNTFTVSSDGTTFVMMQ